MEHEEEREVEIGFISNIKKLYILWLYCDIFLLWRDHA